MLTKIIDFFRGYLLIDIKGNALERFITQIIAQDIKLKDVERVSSDYYRVKIYTSDFNKLRPIVRKRLCRVKIREKKGFKFLFARLQKRFLLVLAVILFIFVLWFASCFLWFISITGLEKIPDSKIYFILNKNGVKQGVYKKNIDLDYLEQILLQEEPRLAWVNLSWEGTHLKIKVVEKKTVKKANPGNIVAKKDGIIKEIIVLKGKSVVNEGDTVAAGQTLIVGLNNEDEKKIKARGIIRAYTWYETIEELDLEYNQAVYTGESSRVFALKIASRIFRIPSPPAYSRYTLSRERKRIIKGRNYKFPLELIIEEYKEVKYFKYNIEKDTALFMARERALNKILDKLDSDSIILDVKSEFKSIQDGKVRVKVFLKAEEDIADNTLEKEGPGE